MIRIATLPLFAIALGGVVSLAPATGEAAFSVLDPAALTAIDASPVLARRGRGADDGPNHDVNDDRGGRGRGRGRDHGPNHN